MLASGRMVCPTADILMSLNFYNVLPAFTKIDRSATSFTLCPILLLTIPEAPMASPVSLQMNPNCSGGDQSLSVPLLF